LGHKIRPIAFVLNLVLVAVLTLSCTITSSTTPATTGEATVVQVIDGDTIEVNISGTTYRVRYIGIDTPEIGEPFYQEATSKNLELVGGKTLRLEKDISETDTYGRLLRYVYIGDLFVNAELARSGYARAITYKPDVKFQGLLESMEREAKLTFRGMWAK
jgi:micrococcal nuclease